MLKLKDNLNILVVDDSSMILQVVCTMLQSHGLTKVDTAGNLKLALSKVESLDMNYDLIILDRYLGEDSGLDVLKAVRRRNNTIPIIMLTQEKAGQKIIEAISDGASDYVVKPFSEQVLISKVMKALKLG